MTSSDPTVVTVISRRYVDIRKLQRYLDDLWQGNYSVTVRNDNYFIKGPRRLTQDQQEKIHDLTRGRRSEKTEVKQNPTHGQHAAGEAVHGRAKVADVVGQEFTPAAGTSSEKQEIEELEPITKLERSSTMQSIKDTFGRIVRRITFRDS